MRGVAAGGMTAIGLGLWCAPVCGDAGAQAQGAAVTSDAAAEAQAHYARGKSFYEAGDFESAQREFASALQLWHGGEEAPAPRLSATQSDGSVGAGSRATVGGPDATASPARSSQNAVPAVNPVAVIDAPLFLDSEATGLTDVRELSRYRERLQGMIRDLSDRIGRLAKRELRHQRQWLEHGRDAAEEQEVAALQSERKELEQERQRLEQLLGLVTQRMAIAYYNRGVEASERQRLGEAVKAFQMAGELDPDDPDIQYNLAIALASQKQYRKAADAFAVTVRLRPDDAEAHYNLAVLYDRHLKHPEAVREHLEAYLRLAPDAADAGATRGWLNVLGRQPPSEN